MNDDNNKGADDVKSPTEGFSNLSLDALAKRLNSSRPPGEASTAPKEGVTAAANPPETESVTEPETEVAVSQTDTVSEEEIPAETPEERKSTLPPEVQEAFDAIALLEDRDSAIKAMGQRMFKALRSRDEAVAEVERLKTQLKEAPQSPEPFDIGAVLSGQDPRLAPVNQQVQLLENAIRNIKSNPDGMTITDGDGKERTFSAEQLKSLLIDYEQQYARALNQQSSLEATIRSEQATTANEARSIARQHYPWIEQKDSPEMTLAIAELKHMGPVAELLKRMPQYPIIMGRYIAGLRQEQTRAAKPKGITPGAAAKPTAQAATPPKLVASATSAAKPKNPLEAQLDQAQKAYRDHGSEQNLSRVNSIKAQIKRQSIAK